MLRDDDLLGDRATLPNQSQFVLDWAQQWQGAGKIVYSRADELQMIVCPVGRRCRADLNASTGCAGSESP